MIGLPLDRLLSPTNPERRERVLQMVRAGYRIADAESVLAAFDLFTRAQVGETPKAFWDGYGRAPEVSRFRFYQLHMAVFLASLDQAQRLPPGREARRLVTSSLGALLEGLEN